MNMENLMEILEALDRKVENLVVTVRRLESERNELRGLLDRANQEKLQIIQEKENIELEMMAVDDNRAEIRTRIQTMIDKIEQLEKMEE